MRIPIVASVCMALVVAGGASALGQDAPALTVPAAAEKAMHEGRGFEERKQLTSAVDSYRAALKAAGGHCDACLYAMAHVQLKMEAYKDAAATEGELAAHAADARARAEAERRAGDAWFQQSMAETEGRGAVEKNPKKAEASLRKAEAVLKQAAADDPTDEAARMQHARVLAALKRDDDARTEFAACAAIAGTSAEECARARRFAQDVSRARGEPVPAFTAKTMDGQPISLDALAGKVVLVDFWATWCGPCRSDSDYVQSLLGDFPKDKFVLLEVNVDSNAETWRNYVKKERLDGVHLHDEGHALQDVFHVTAYPTYVIFDGDGVVQLREVGVKGDLRGTVRRLLAPTAAVATASQAR